MQFIDNGRPSYNSSNLLKLFVFGYLNRIRSSRLDLYLCPAGQQLQTNGAWYFKKQGKTTNRMKHYKTSACKACPRFERCTKNKVGRLIERTEHAELIEAKKQWIELNKEQLCQI